MATPVFAGYLIKGIDVTRCPKEYKLGEGEPGNAYTVYLRLTSFRTKETDPFDVPPECDSELRQFWAESLKKHVRNVPESKKRPVFSGVEYCESEDGAVLAVHGTTLAIIEGHQRSVQSKGSRSVLESLVADSNSTMKEELNRRDRFRANALEIKFHCHRDG